MRKSVVVAVVLAIIAGLTGAWVAVAPLATAHAGHVITIADRSAFEGTADGQPPALKTMTISLSSPPQVGEEITVQWSTSEMQPTPEARQADLIPVPEDPRFPNDYVESSGAVTFTAGEETPTEEEISIPVTQDGAHEDDERFRVLLGNASCAGVGCGVTIGDAEGIFTILNDDAIPSFLIRVPDGTETGVPHPPVEGNVGQLNYEFEVARSGGTENTVTVNWATADGTATDADNDYEPRSGALTFGPGNGGGDPQVVAVPVNGDTKGEANETFNVNISITVPDTVATVSDSNAQGTINNDDGAVPAEMRISDAQAVEGNTGAGNTLVFTVTLDREPGNNRDATVNYTTQPGSATAADFVPESGTLTFQNLEKTKQIDIQIIGDVADEPNEAMSVVLSKPQPCCTPGFDYTIERGTGQGRITDDDGEVVLPDFNGDGFDDAAFGAPGEDSGSLSDVGAVNVIYGRANSGLSANPTPDDQVLVGTAANDRYGAALAEGDFNGDGFADLAVGIPGASGGAGAVSVHYGGSSGLSETGSQLLSQAGAVEEDQEAGDGFGTALTASDLNGDGRIDLAVGVPGETVGAGPEDAGGVNVLYGTSDGLSTATDQFWHQDRTDGPTVNVPEEADAGDAFGRVLAAGDLNGDTFGDLVVGTPSEDVTATNQGAATVLLGSAGVGLTAAGSQLWHQGQPAVNESPGSNDGFASSLTVGDFDGDGRGDLAVGVPLEDLPGDADAGGVNVLYGFDAAGLSADGDQFWSQDSGGILDSTQPGDRFGTDVEAADFDGDGRDDLAIGVPKEDYGGTKTDAGVTHALYGAATAGLAAGGNQHWHQDVDRVRGLGEVRDNFGAVVSAGDFDGDGFADLVVGVPFEDLGSNANAGSANVLYGTASNLRSSGNQDWHQDAIDVGGSAEEDDTFARALS